jgi:hypothetical protein
MMTDTQGSPYRNVQASALPEDADARIWAIRRQAALRRHAIGRLRYMNTQHAMHAWERRYSDPLAPYGLAFLYAQPDHAQPEGGLLTLKAATRLWLAGPESANLPRLLFNLNNAVAQRGGDPDFDLRRDLADRFDEQMAEDACYVGLGVSALDTYSGTWQQACATVDRYADVPGQIRIVMTDSTMIMCDRRGLADFSSFTVQSTHALSESLIDTPYPYSAVAAQDFRTDPAHSEVLRWMEELNLSLWQADNARLVARQAGPRSHRRQA